MRIRLLYLTIGTGLGIGGYHAYRQYKPERVYTSATNDMINSYLASHKLEQGYLITVLNSLGFMLKSFYTYGMDTKLKGFNFNSTYLKRDEVRDQSKQITQVSCIFSPTQTICGHPQILHGGATATIIDHSFGILTVLNSKSSVATAQLKIRYKRPIKKDQFYVFEGHVVQKMGRKMKVKGVIKQLETGQIKVQTQGLFMTVNWDNQLSRVLTKFFQTINFKDYSDLHHTHPMHVDYRQQITSQSQKIKNIPSSNLPQKNNIPEKKLSTREQIKLVKQSLLKNQKAELVDDSRLDKLEQLVRKLQQRQNLVQIKTSQLQNLLHKQSGKHPEQK